MEKPEEVFPEAKEAEKSPKGLKSGEVFEEAAEAPIEANTIFDPEEELKGVLRFSGKERKSKFEEYREKYAYQKEGLAEMQQVVREKIMDYPEVSEEELFTLAGELGARYGFTPEQLISTGRVINKYIENHKIINETLAKFATEKDGQPATNGKELFEAAFFEEPLGKIEVLAGPMTIYLRIHDPRDFYQAVALQSILTGVNPPTFEKATGGIGGILVHGRRVEEKIGKCLLAEIDGLLAIENFELVLKTAKERGLSDEKAREWVKSETKGYFLHEEQHSIDEIFEHPPGADLFLGESIRDAENEEEKASLLRIFLREERKVTDSRAKNELLAYLTGQLNEKNAEALFNQAKINFKRGGYYRENYSHNIKKAEDFLLSRLGEDHRKLIEDTLEKIYGEEHEKIVDRGINALKDLLAGDYSEASRNRTRNLLSTVPLRRWPREVGNFLKR